MDLTPNREGYLVGEDWRECTNCGSLFPRRNAKASICIICDRARRASVPIEERILRRARHKSKERGHSFDLTIEDIHVPSHCPILGGPFDLNLHPNYEAMLLGPSIDRIDNTKGYVKGNVWIISLLANQMKNAASPDQLIKFGKWTKDYFGWNDD